MQLKSTQFKYFQTTMLGFATIERFKKSLLAQIFHPFKPFIRK
jgi:hypothetical protein